MQKRSKRDTPAYFDYKDVKTLNGMTDVKKWFYQNWSKKGVLEIKVFDNIALHEDNLIETWTFEENLQKLSEKATKAAPEERGRPAQRMGALISNFQSERR